MEDETAFLRRRIAQETAAARSASMPEAAKAHRMLAAAYAARLGGAEPPAVTDRSVTPASAPGED